MVKDKYKKQNTNVDCVCADFRILYKSLELNKTEKSTTKVLSTNLH